MLVGERAPRVDAAGDDGPTSTAAGVPPACSARASSSRPSTRRDSRATSASEPATSASASAPGRDLRLQVLEPEPQRRQRRPQLVRRVGDELLLRAPTSRSTWAAVSLNRAVSCAISGGPRGTTARVARSPSPNRVAASTSRSIGTVT